MKLDWIIVGLGNPGPRYQFTRHNVGFIALDYASEKIGFDFQNTGSLGKLTKAFCAEHNWQIPSTDPKRCLWLQPQTYMNLSGESLRMLYQKHPHLLQTPLVVLHDEVDIPLGRIKIKLGGSDAGHNGLKSIRSVLGHGNFYRIRLGVGKPISGNGQELADYVLEQFSAQDELKLGPMIENSLNVLQTLLWEGLEKAQERCARQS